MIKVISKQLEKQIEEDEIKFKCFEKKGFDNLNKKELEDLKEINKRLISYYTRCVKCKSLSTYIRIKDNEKVCRICGYVQQLDGKKNE